LERSSQRFSGMKQRAYGLWDRTNFWNRLF
jgi:hypothetical protein